MNAISHPCKALSKEQYNIRLDALRPKLLNAHFALRNSRSSVVIIVGGVEGAGKGEIVWSLNEWLDPRGIETHTFGLLKKLDRRRPLFWHYNQALPARGRVGVLFGSWYTDPIVGRAVGDWKRGQFDEAMQSINRFEKMLALDGTVFLKLWLHISKDTLKHRLDDAPVQNELRWRFLPPGSRLLELYDDFRAASQTALRMTHTESAPWHRVDAGDARRRTLAVAELVLRTLEYAAKNKPSSSPSVRKASGVSGRKTAAAAGSLLKQTDLDAVLTKEEYEKKLPKYQSRLLKLAWKMFRKERSCLLVFEGWDAAGKGGTIRRVTQALDPRLYQVVGFAAPTAEERAHHYLWRFWRNLPSAGMTAIFDRSYYGRVLVERVEGFASPDEWGRAYDEIRDFESQLTEGGVVLCKFWLHISPEEQLKRFKARQEVAFKRYKITDEDWRNREKWPQYESAVEDMIARTGTPSAPWTIVPANDKRMARIVVLKTVCRRLKEAL